MAPSTKKPKSKRSAQQRSDDFIMNTNDSSIVSKRCVSKLYLPKEPDFYQPFVSKFVRRNPLINRGYWLRMHAIEQVVRCFIEEDPERPKVVVNLGCGYDPLPFQIWHRYPTICVNTTFVDVDYPHLIARKRDRMLTDSLLRDELLKTNLRPSEHPVYLRSDRYMALGCDLRDITTLERVLKAEFDTHSSHLLFVAEVSVTYMPISDSDALIHWASTLKDARFCLLEQYLPEGPDHPFAKTMLKHFDKLQTPIQAIKQYPSLKQQESRFINAGWLAVETSRNLWDLWGDDSFTPTHLRRSLDKVEPFDEWEEFALFASHYFMLVASNVISSAPGHAPAVGGLHAAAQRKNTMEMPLLTLTHYESPPGAQLTFRRFGAAFVLGEGTVAIHGGQGPQHRLANIDLLSRGQSKATIHPLPPTQARVCHTITPIDPNRALLVGGRKSPTQVLADCWMMANGAWEQVEDLEPGRYRHSSVKVEILSGESKTEAVLVCGGKTSDGIVLDEWCLWLPSQGWQTIPVTGPRPQARTSAAISTSNHSLSRGLLIGGMDPDGTVLDEIWSWEILASSTIQLRFIDRTRHINSLPAMSLHARLGASLLPFGDFLLLFGGICRKGILGFAEDFLLIFDGPIITYDVANLETMASGLPLLVGTSAVLASKEEIIITGGGAVCFSMGSFWNEGYFSITQGSQTPSPQTFSIAQIDQPSPPRDSDPIVRAKGKKETSNYQDSQNTDLPSVARVRLKSPEDFSQLVAASKPAIMEGLDLGPCVQLWTLEYLKEKLGVNRELVIHECDSDRMTFKDKNFQYVKRTVGEFLDGISKGKKTYLRAASKNQPNRLPTKIEDDFPTIASDFRLPEALSPILRSYHSSPLRISGPVSLWLHYDVLANVLCQIKGRKSLRLFPPSDVKYLNYPPGGSSSNINVLKSKDPKLSHTHPQIAVLGPGDVLFIPPMWSHTATPEEDVSVAVNVFFRNLSSGYAAGKDVYGNRDLQAYENGRRDVEKILKAFRDVPCDLAMFYLSRLAAEIQERAEQLGLQA
ncbi:LCM-domain-containing protein [Lindgomyces ingoldianus]|uniref:LCM-domain-containing protein n=1 Tax=Lindgomyces ingoldianus TaxID=673940 RepID=A0ACB6R398_9PLEO|nr:LCM-domain-containing protein [Lindgomyces ingoldianus]KAF2473794.1 LCM-domain-containing protein [Lindgomyces ingoldianus]